jgi:hypothetical protein
MPDDSARILARHILGFMCLFRNRLAAKTVVKGFTIPQMGFFPYDPVVVAMLLWERTNKYKTTTKQ